MVESAVQAGSIIGTTAKLGGPGGNGPSIRNCNDGDVVIGFFGRAATVIDQLGVICGHLDSNGTIGNQYWPGSVGGGGGSPFVIVCSGYVNGVRIQANNHSLATSTATVVNRIEARCSGGGPISVGPIATHTEHHWFCQPVWGGFQCVDMPMTVTDPFQDFPQLGAAVGGIGMWTGTYVDAFQVSYRNVF